MPVLFKRSIGYGFKLKYKHIIILGGKKEQYGHFKGQQLSLKYELLFNTAELHFVEHLILGFSL